MQKPNNYNNTMAATSEFDRLPAGNYVVKIMKVEETKSKTGKEMIIVNYDIAEGEYKDYFMKAWKSDTREEKKWNGRAWILTQDKDGNCSRGFKGFTEALEDSNAGYMIPWGEKAADSMAGKLIGAQMRDEEYQNNSGDYRMMAKIAYWASVEDIRSGKFKELAPKYIDRSAETTPSGFMSVPESTEEELPFK